VSTEEQFEQMLSIELPISNGEDSSTSTKDSVTQKPQGEPGPGERSSSLDVLSLEELAIFDRPGETDEGASNSLICGRDRIKITSQMLDGNDFTGTQVPSTSAKELERMLDIELPSLNDEEDSFTSPKVFSIQNQGERSTFEPSSYVEVLSSELEAIFDKPTETTVGYNTPCDHDEPILDISIDP